MPYQMETLQQTVNDLRGTLKAILGSTTTLIVEVKFLSLYHVVSYLCNYESSPIPHALVCIYYKQTLKNDV